MSDLALELRAARPVAPEALRQRVVEIAAHEVAPPAPHRLSLPRIRFRRAALVLVPACLAVAVLGALAHGLATSGSSGSPSLPTALVDRQPVGAPPPRAEDRAAPNAQALSRQARTAEKGLPPAIGLPPSHNRLQDYSASMRLRLDDVDGLSDATLRAMRIARGFGGYVVSVRYDSSDRQERGEAYLTLRVPVERIQNAVLRFSSLGTILDQNIVIRDVQPRVDALERRIVQLRSQIAAVDAQLRNPNVSEADRARLQFRRERLATQLRQAARSRQATIRQAQFATVSLVLTTVKAEKKATPPGRFQRTLDDAGGILLAEAAWTLLVLAVAMPFVLLLALALWGVRAARRLGDRRLLESS